MTDDSDPTADSRDMRAVHDMYRREFASFPALVGSVRPGDRERAEIVADHIEFVMRLLHAHHHSEDDLVWPKLAARAPADVAPLLAAMRTDHDDIDRRLHDVESSIVAWRAHPVAGNRDHVAHVLRELLPPLERHLATEESQALSLIDRFLTAAEWAQVGNAGLAELPASSYPLLFGMLLHDLDAEMYQLIKDTVPAEVFDTFAFTGPQEYARHTERLYGEQAPAPHEG